MSKKYEQRPIDELTNSEKVLENRHNIDVLNEMIQEGNIPSSDGNVKITSDKEPLNKLSTQKDVNEYIVNEFESGDINARFDTVVNGKELKTHDGKINFHSTTNPTTHYNLVEQSKLDNLFKEYVEGTPEEDLDKDTVYLTKGTLTGAGLFGDGSSTESQSTKAETLISEFAEVKDGELDLFAIDKTTGFKYTTSISKDGITSDNDVIAPGKVISDIHQSLTNPASYESYVVDPINGVIKESNGIAQHNFENVFVDENVETTSLTINNSEAKKVVEIDEATGEDKTQLHLPTTEKVKEIGSQHFADKVAYGWDNDGKLSIQSKHDAINGKDIISVSFDESEDGFLFERNRTDGQWSVNPLNTPNPWGTPKLSWTTHYKGDNPVEQNNSTNGTTEAFAWEGQGSGLDRFSQLDTDGFFIDVPVGSLDMWPNATDVNKDLSVELIMDINTFLTSTGETFTKPAKQRKVITLPVNPDEPVYTDITFVATIGTRRSSDSYLIPTESRHFYCRAKVAVENGKYTLSLQEQVRYETFTYQEDGTGGKTDEGFILMSDGDIRVREVRYE